MNPSKQKLARLAAMIHGDLLQRQNKHLMPEFPQHHCDRARELSRRLGQAHARGWHNATNTLLQDYQSAVAQLEYELQQLRTDIAGLLAPRHLASTGDIYRDLIVLQDEFSALSWDAKQRR